MEINKLKNESALVDKAVNDFLQTAKEAWGASTPLRVGLASGQSFVLFYRQLVEQVKKSQIHLSKSSFFALDEYEFQEGTDADTFLQFSFAEYYKKNLLDFVPEVKLRLPTNETQLFQMDLEIKSQPLDVQLLGIGRNGHIAFNEPGSSFDSPSRRVLLSSSTREANKLSNTNITHAYTLGMSTILSAKKLIVLAFGSSKKSALSKLQAGIVTSEWPCTFLLNHPNCHLYTIDS